MKKLISLVLILFAFCSCVVDDVTPVEISHNLQDSEVIIASTANVVETLEITSNRPWTISLNDTKAIPEWISAKPLSGEAGTHTITITVNENKTDDEREAFLTLLAGDATNIITLTQVQNDVLGLDVTELIFLAEGETKSVMLSKNLDYTVSIPTDISWLNMVETRSVVEDKLEFIAVANTDAPRSTIVTITAGKLIQTINVTQEVIDEILIPQIYIDVEGGVDVTTKDYYDAVVRIDGGDKYADLAEVSTRVKGRGNSTWGMPKKPYKLKLDKKASLLGLDKEKDWVLLANYIDPSLMVNSMAMKAGAQMNVSFVNTMIPVDVIMNGVYKGSYVLTEQVEVKSARVNLSDNGYLLELDANFDEDYQYRSPLINLPVMVKGTELDLNIHFDAIKAEFNALEAAIMADDFPNNGYRDLIDIETVAAFLLVNELTMNFEITAHPKSVFIHKDEGAKFGLGPIWDFDWTCGYEPGSVPHFELYNMDILASGGKGAIFFNRFLLDPEFVTIYKQKWNEFANNQQGEFFDYMNNYAELLSVSAERNFEMWPEPNNRSFEAEVERMESWFRLRIAFLSDKINKL